jgi:type VI secretion system FHA domain protein
MAIQLLIEGPAGSRTFTLEPTGKSFIAGRDAGADIHLSDPERVLSRKHVVLRPLLHEVEVTVISNSGSVGTSRGLLGAGQSALLQLGGWLTLGPYTVTVQASGSALDSSEFLDSWRIADGGSQVAGAVGAEASNRLLGAAAPAVASSPALDTVWIGVSRPAMTRGFSGLPSTGTVASHGASAGFEGHGALGAEPAVDGAAAIDRLLGDALSPGHVDPARRPLEVHIGPPSLPDPLPQPATLRTPATPSNRSDQSDTPPSDDGTDPSVWRSLAAAARAQLSGLASTWTSGSPSPTASGPLLRPADQGTDELPTLATHEDTLPGLATSMSPATAPYSRSVGTVEDSTGRQLADRSDIEALARGLGVRLPDNFATSDWEHVGATLRRILDGAWRALRARELLVQRLAVNTSDATALYEPLRQTDPDLGPALQQALLGPASADVLRNMEHAARESVARLMTHDLAMHAAARSCVESMIEQFSPQKLSALLDRKPSTIGFGPMRQARLWRAYCEYHFERSGRLDEWVDQLYVAGFLEAYRRETARLENARSLAGGNQSVPGAGCSGK